MVLLVASATKSATVSATGLLAEPVHTSPFKLTLTRFPLAAGQLKSSSCRRIAVEPVFLMGSWRVFLSNLSVPGAMEQSGPGGHTCALAVALTVITPPLT